jgi:hypothetical protein
MTWLGVLAGVLVVVFLLAQWRSMRDEDRATVGMQSGPSRRVRAGERAVDPLPKLRA